MKKVLSILIAFLAWGAIFFGQVAYSVDWIWIMLSMFFIGYPLSAFIAEKITGIDPYKMMLP